MVRRALRSGFRVSALLLLAARPSISQFETRSITGVVTDLDGNALGGAVVQLENSASLVVVSYITGKNGRYYFGLLSYDVNYTLKADYRNHWSKPKTLSAFNPSKHPEIALVIPVD